MTKCQRFGWVPEWPKGADCKSVATRFEGSNPSPTICLNRLCPSGGTGRRTGLKILRGKTRTGSIPVSGIPIQTPYRAQIAQLVEQRTENPRVLGSIPSLGTT